MGAYNTWTAICANIELVLSWLVGRGDASYAKVFIDDLARAPQKPCSAHHGRPQGISVNRSE